MESPVRALADDALEWQDATTLQQQLANGGLTSQALLRHCLQRIRRIACGGLDTPAYLQALAANQRLARTEGLDALFSGHWLDAVVAPSGNPAWRTDHLLGDHGTRGGMGAPFAVAGYPHVTVPMGLVAAMPVGLSMGALAWQDARLLGLAHADEQASRMRRAPRFLRDAG